MYPGHIAAESKQSASVSQHVLHNISKVYQNTWSKTGTTLNYSNLYPSWHIFSSLRRNIWNFCLVHM